MVRTAHSYAQAGLGTRLWIVVDDSRSVCRRRFADGKRAAFRRARLDEPRQLKRLLQGRGLLPWGFSKGSTPLGPVEEEKRMSDYSPKLTNSFNERMRLRPLRRQQEHVHFLYEFR